MRSRANDEAMAEMYRDDPAFTLELVSNALADGDLEEGRVILRQVAQVVSCQSILSRPLREAIMQLKVRTAVLDSGGKS